MKKILFFIPLLAFLLLGCSDENFKQNDPFQSKSFQAVEDSYQKFMDARTEALVSFAENETKTSEEIMMLVSEGEKQRAEYLRMVSEEVDKRVAENTPYDKEEFAQFKDDLRKEIFSKEYSDWRDKLNGAKFDLPLIKGQYLEALKQFRAEFPKVSIEDVRTNLGADTFSSK